MALDHEAILDQKNAPRAYTGRLAVICDDFPSFARSCENMGVAEGAHVVAAILVAVGQRQSSMFLKVASIDTEELVDGRVWLRTDRRVWIWVRLNGDRTWIIDAFRTLASVPIPAPRPIPSCRTVVTMRHVWW
jgi:hypothetical protein